MSELARALIGAGLDVEVATTAEEVEAPTTLEGNHLKLHLAPMRARARHLALDGFRQERKHLGRLIRASGAGVIHAHWTYEFAWAALDSGRPAVVTAHDAPLTILRYHRDAYRAIRTAMAYLVRSRVKTLTANSPYLARAWRRQMLYRRDIPVIANVVRPVATTTAKKAGGEVAAPTILDVTDDGRRKNVHSLVRAMTDVLVRRPDARLRLVGPGLTAESECAQLADRLGVRHAVEFVGSLNADAVKDEYLGATVFVHASLEESFGLTAAEAMAHGLPVVAGARAGAIPWLLDEGRAGLLVDVRRSIAIAAGICRLLDDSRLREKLGTAGKKRVESAFSPAAVASSWIRQYESLSKTPQ